MPWAPGPQAAFMRSNFLGPIGTALMSLTPRQRAVSSEQADIACVCRAFLDCRRESVM
jgi:hypothetical protein